MLLSFDKALRWSCVGVDEISCGKGAGLGLGIIHTYNTHLRLRNLTRTHLLMWDPFSLPPRSLLADDDFIDNVPKQDADPSNTSQGQVRRAFRGPIRPTVRYLILTPTTREPYTTLTIP